MIFPRMVGNIHPGHPTTKENGSPQCFVGGSLDYMDAINDDLFGAATCVA